MPSSWFSNSRVPSRTSQERSSSKPGDIHIGTITFIPQRRRFLDMGGSLNVTSNGFDQYHDADIDAARLTFSIVALLLVPLQIFANLITFLAICVFSRLHTIQHILVANFAFSGFLSGIVFNPTMAVYWFPDYVVHVDKSNKDVCISFFLPLIFAGVCAVLNHTMITADRFFAIIFPFRYIEVMSVEKLRGIIIVVWVFCTALAVLPYGWNIYTPGQCEMNGTLDTYYIQFAYVLVGFCIIISSVFNTFVFLKAFKYNKQLRKVMTEDQLKSNKDRLRNAKLSVFLYTIYLLLYMPYLLSVPLKTIYPNSKAAVIFHTAAATIAILHFSVATLVYIVVKKDSREAIKLLLSQPPWRWRDMRFNQLEVTTVERSFVNLTQLPRQKKKFGCFSGNRSPERGHIPARGTPSAGAMSTGAMSAGAMSSRSDIRSSPKSSPKTSPMSSVKYSTKSSGIFSRYFFSSSQHSVGTTKSTQAL